MQWWTDVRVDPDAAREAADALRLLAARLDAATELRQRSADEARRDWDGRAREDADLTLGRQHDEAAGLVARLRLAAHRVDSGVEAALAEQRRREQHREAEAARLRDHPTVPPVGAGVGVAP